MKKSSLAVILMFGLIFSLFAVGMASTTDEGTVSFSVKATQSITAENISLGNLASGANESNQTPVTVSSNTAWYVTAQAAENFSDGENPATALPIENLVLAGTAMSLDSDITIASGSATESETPSIATGMTIPSDSSLVGKSFSTTITYTIVAQ